MSIAATNFTHNKVDGAGEDHEYRFSKESCCHNVRDMDITPYLMPNEKVTNIRSSGSHGSEVSVQHSKDELKWIFPHTDQVDERQEDELMQH